MKKQIWKYEEIQELRDAIKHYKTVLVGGCFDVLHYGHLTFLKNAKALGDVLVIALESDDFIRASKKRNPVHTQLQRAEMLTSHHIVDHVILLPFMETDEEYRKLVQDVSPRFIAVTEGDPHLDNKKKYASQIEGEVYIVSSYIPGFSTTHILDHETISRSRSS